MKNAIIDIVKDMLDENEGMECYSCDMAGKLFEPVLMDGSYTCSRAKAVSWIASYYDDIAELLEEVGEEVLQARMAFENPELFQVCIMREVAEKMFCQCPTIVGNWDKKITLNEKTNKKLKKELDNLDIE